MKPLIPFLGLMLLTGCASERMAGEAKTAKSMQVAQADIAPASAMAPMGGEATAPSPDAAPVAKAPAMPRKIIFTGEVTLICEDLDKAAAGLETRAKEFGGYISNANQTGARGETREGS